MDVCGFKDIPFSGYEFAYDNGRELDEKIQFRLDRALAGGMYSSFPRESSVALGEGMVRPLSHQTHAVE